MNYIEDFENYIYENIRTNPRGKQKVYYIS